MGKLSNVTSIYFSGGLKPLVSFWYWTAMKFSSLPLWCSSRPPEAAALHPQVATSGASTTTTGWVVLPGENPPSPFSAFTTGRRKMIRKPSWIQIIQKPGSCDWRVTHDLLGNYAIAVPAWFVETLAFCMLFCFNCLQEKSRCHGTMFLPFPGYIAVETTVPCYVAGTPRTSHTAVTQWARGSRGTKWGTLRFGHDEALSFGRCQNHPKPTFTIHWFSFRQGPIYLH